MPNPARAFTPYGTVQVDDDAPLLNEARRLHETMHDLHPRAHLGMTGALETVFKLSTFLARRGVFDRLDPATRCEMASARESIP